MWWSSTKKAARRQGAGDSYLWSACGAVFFEQNRNKTPCNHRDIFHPPTLSEMLFRRLKASFLVLRNSSSNFLTFRIFKSFWLFCKISIEVEKDILKKISIDTPSTGNLPPLPTLKKNSSFFQKTHSFFLKNPICVSYWELFLFQSHSATILLKFGD